MTAVYEHAGIRIQYPENWQLRPNVESPDAKSILAESPSGAFWSLEVFSSGMTVEVACAEVLRAMRNEYEEIEVEPTVEVLGEMKAEGYNITFYCLDMLVSARVVGWESRALGTLILQYQAEDREFQRLERVFQAISTSLLLNRDAQIASDNLPS